MHKSTFLLKGIITCVVPAHWHNWTLALYDELFLHFDICMKYVLIYMYIIFVDFICIFLYNLLYMQLFI